MLGADDLSIGPRFAGLDPIIARRAHGDAVYNKALGVTLKFVQMPHWRTSYWEGQLAMPGSEAPLNVIFEVKCDELPHAGHEFIVRGARRMQVRQTANALPLINAALRENGHRKVAADDCVLTLIRVGANPVLDYDLGFRVRTLPNLIFVVAHRGIQPHQVRIDSVCDLSSSAEGT